LKYLNCRFLVNPDFQFESNKTFRPALVTFDLSVEVPYAGQKLKLRERRRFSPVHENRPGFWDYRIRTQIRLNRKTKKQENKKATKQQNNKTRKPFDFAQGKQQTLRPVLQSGA